MRHGYLHICVILDESASMAALRNDVLYSLTEFFKERRVVTSRQVKVDFYLFAESIKGVSSNVDLNDFDTEFLEMSYECRGATAFNDAFCEAVDTLGSDFARMSEAERPERVIVAVVTDGIDNCSVKTTLDDVFRRLDEQTSVYNWDFEFFYAQPYQLRERCFDDESVLAVVAEPDEEEESAVESVAAPLGDDFSERVETINDDAQIESVVSEDDANLEYEPTPYVKDVDERVDSFVEETPVQSVETSFDNGRFERVDDEDLAPVVQKEDVPQPVDEEFETTPDAFIETENRSLPSAEADESERPESSDLPADEEENVIDSSPIVNQDVASDDETDEKDGRDDQTADVVVDDRLVNEYVGDESEKEESILDKDERFDEPQNEFPAETALNLDDVQASEKEPHPDDSPCPPCPPNEYLGALETPSEDKDERGDASQNEISQVLVDAAPQSATEETTESEVVEPLIVEEKTTELDADETPTAKEETAELDTVETPDIEEETIELESAEPLVAEGEATEPDADETPVAEEETAELDTVETPDIEEETIELESAEPLVVEEETIDLDTDDAPVVDEETVEPETDDTPVAEEETIDLDADEAPIVEEEATEPETDDTPVVEEETIDLDSDDAPIVEEDATDPETDDTPVVEEETIDLDSDEAPVVDEDATDPETDDTPVAEEETIDLDSDDAQVAEEETVEPESDDTPVVDEETVEPETDDMPVAEEETIDLDSDDAPIVEEEATEPETDDAPVAEEETIDLDSDEAPVVEEETVEPETDDTPVVEEETIEPETDDTPVVEEEAATPEPTSQESNATPSDSGVKTVEKKEENTPPPPKKAHPSYSILDYGVTHPPKRPETPTQTPSKDEPRPSQPQTAPKRRPQYSLGSTLERKVEVANPKTDVDFRHDRKTALDVAPKAKEEEKPVQINPSRASFSIAQTGPLVFNSPQRVKSNATEEKAGLSVESVGNDLSLRDDKEERYGRALRRYVRNAAPSPQSATKPTQNVPPTPKLSLSQPRPSEQPAPSPTPTPVAQPSAPPEPSLQKPTEPEPVVKSAPIQAPSGSSAPAEVRAPKLVVDSEEDRRFTENFAASFNRTLDETIHEKPTSHEKTYLPDLDDRTSAKEHKNGADADQDSNSDAGGKKHGFFTRIFGKK